MYSNYDYIYYQALTNVQYEMVSNFHWTNVKDFLQSFLLNISSRQLDYIHKNKLFEYGILILFSLNKRPRLPAKFAQVCIASG